MVWLPVFGFLMCAQMFMYVIVHRGCTDTVKETTLGEKSLATPGLKVKLLSFLHRSGFSQFQSNTLATELFLIIKIKNTWTHLPSPAHWYSRLPSGSPGPVSVGLALNSAALQGALLAMFPLCGQIPSLTAPVSMRTGWSVSWFPSTSAAAAVMISSCCC